MNTEQIAALASAIDERTARGEVQVGWKLGFGSDQGKETLSIDHPLVGALFDAGRREPDSDITFGELKTPMVEPEVAVWMGTDCQPGASAEELQAAVSSLVPAIELADLAFPPKDPVEVLAGNIYQSCWVAGPDDESGWGAGGEQTVQVIFGDQQWSQRKPETMTGPLLVGLAHCNEVAHALGRGLLAGDIVLLGSVIPPQRVFPAAFSVTLADGRRVQATFS